MAQLHAGGFWDKWNVDKTPKKLQVYHFYFPLAIHGLGLSVAFLLLLLEMAWKTFFEETNKQHVGKKGKIFIVPIKQ